MGLLRPSTTETPGGSIPPVGSIKSSWGSICLRWRLCASCADHSRLISYQWSSFLRGSGQLAPSCWQVMALIILIERRFNWPWNELCEPSWNSKQNLFRPIPAGCFILNSMWLALEMIHEASEESPSISQRIWQRSSSRWRPSRWISFKHTLKVIAENQKQKKKERKKEIPAESQRWRRIFFGGVAKEREKRDASNGFENPNQSQKIRPKKSPKRMANKSLKNPIKVLLAGDIKTWTGAYLNIQYGIMKKK